MTITKHKCESCDKESPADRPEPGWISFDATGQKLVIRSGDHLIEMESMTKWHKESCTEYAKYRLDFCSKECLLKFLKI